MKNNNTDAISSITRGPRQTNMELLRIVAMVMVLTVHADFAALGSPDSEFDGFYGALNSLTRTGFEMLAIVSVNLFVLISGWFSIKATARGIMAFGFQTVFFLTGCYVIVCLVNYVSSGNLHITGEGIAGCVAMTSAMWFVKAYAALYLLSPMLNLFCEKAGERGLRVTIVLFYLYQTIWGFLGPNPSVSDGYSVFSFIGLYLLARYMRLYYKGERRNETWLWGYLIAAGLNVAAYYTAPERVVVTSYCNPIVVFEALCLMMYFSGLKMKHNPFVNRVAASCFAVYLLHGSPAVMGQYLKICQKAYEFGDGIVAISGIALVMTAFFVAAIAIDQLRLKLWELWGGKLTEKAEKLTKFIADRDCLR